MSEGKIDLSQSYGSVRVMDHVDSDTKQANPNCVVDMQCFTIEQTDCVVKVKCITIDVNSLAYVAGKKKEKGKVLNSTAIRAGYPYTKTGELPRAPRL